MVWVPRKYRLGFKPSLPVEVDRSHPLLRGCLVYLPLLEGGGSKSVFLPNGGRASLRAGSTASWVQTAYGRALQPNGLTSNSKRDGFYIYENQVSLAGLT